METIRKRRSIRKYLAKDVPADLLDELLETAARAQTMGNLQLYSVVVTRDQAMKEQLSPAHFNQPMVKGAPVVLTFCADFNRTTQWCKCRKAVPGYDNLLSFMNAASDALLFTQNFCNLAEEKGLGICYLGTTIYNAGDIIRILQLPKLVVPVATITVGWPDEHPEQSDRLPLAAFVHEETYKDYTPEDIDRYYCPKEALAENRHFVEINQKETLAQIFTDIRYTREANVSISASLLKTLQEQGFMQ
ncbi:MAG: NADPH-dependent oxidoreductase [Bacteroidaceae bacterium]|nr:NADPH-dependent oxidoreductase [Bacteroidaceae bacterium]